MKKVAIIAGFFVFILVLGISFSSAFWPFDFLKKAFGKITGKVIEENEYSLILKDVTNVGRSRVLELGTEYFFVDKITNPVFMLSSDRQYLYDYPEKQYLGQLIISYTFGAKSLEPFTSEITFIDRENNRKMLTAYFPAFDTSSGKKMYFYVGKDGSTYYADREHDGLNDERTELLSFSEAMSSEHIAIAAPAGNKAVFIEKVESPVEKKETSTAKTPTFYGSGYDSEEIQQVSCKDSDSGKDYSIGGSVKYAGKIIQDSCISDKELREGYCTSSGRATYEIYDCSKEGKECKEGACAGESVKIISIKVISIKVISIYNESAGYIGDKIIFENINSGERYNASITSEGSGFLIIRGKTYEILYFGNSTASLKERYIIFEGKKIYENGVFEIGVSSYVNDDGGLDEIEIKAYTDKDVYFTLDPVEVRTILPMFMDCNQSAVYADGSESSISYGGCWPDGRVSFSHSFSGPVENVRFKVVAWNPKNHLERYVLYTNYFDVVQSAQEPECENGCALDGRCYSFGLRKDGKYCSDLGEFMEQKDSEGVCENNFECVENMCSAGQCIDVRRIIAENRNLKTVLIQVLCRLGNLFNSEGYRQCLVERFREIEENPLGEISNSLMSPLFKEVLDTVPEGYREVDSSTYNYENGTLEVKIIEYDSEIDLREISKLGLDLEDRFQDTVFQGTSEGNGLKITGVIENSMLLIWPNHKNLIIMLYEYRVPKNNINSLIESYLSKYPPALKITEIEYGEEGDYDFPDYFPKGVISPISLEGEIKLGETKSFNFSDDLVFNINLLSMDNESITIEREVLFKGKSIALITLVENDNILTRAFKRTKAIKRGLEKETFTVPYRGRSSVELSSYEEGEHYTFPVKTTPPTFGNIYVNFRPRDEGVIANSKLCLNNIDITGERAKNNITVLFVPIYFDGVHSLIDMHEELNRKIYTPSFEEINLYLDKKEGEFLGSNNLYLNFTVSDPIKLSTNELGVSNVAEYNSLIFKRIRGKNPGKYDIYVLSFYDSSENEMRLREKLSVYGINPYPEGGGFASVLGEENKVDLVYMIDKESANEGLKNHLTKVMLHEILHVFGASELMYQAQNLYFIENYTGQELIDNADSAYDSRIYKREFQNIDSSVAIELGWSDSNENEVLDVNEFCLREEVLNISQ